jgi:hypothetical protein
MPALTGSGGGLIVVNATSTLHFDGTITANGNDASDNSGGGSGGTAMIISKYLYGVGLGKLMANGGRGGNAAGGGGGGGIVAITRLVPSNSEFDLQVQNLSALGGLASTSSSQKRIKVTEPVDPCKEANYPQPGCAGVIMWPKCPPGYGNNVTSTQLCLLCPTGKYSSSKGNFECEKCENKPDHSKYTESGQSSPDCPYECDRGYLTEECQTPFQNFIEGMGGWGVVAGVLVGFVVIVFCPLIAYRGLKRYGYIEPKDTSTRKLLHRFGNLTERINVAGMKPGLTVQEDSVRNSLFLLSETFSAQEGSEFRINNQHEDFPRIDGGESYGSKRKYTCNLHICYFIRV